MLEVCRELEKHTVSVHQLLIGYYKKAAVEGWMAASGSVTLISAHGKNVVVDCGNPWNGNEIIGCQ